MKKTIIPIICIFCFMAISINVLAQSVKSTRKTIKANMENFQEFVSNPKKINASIRSAYGVAGEKRFNVRNGFCMAEDYRIPKKVGLLSFYIQDKSYSVNDGHGTITIYKATEEKVNAIAQRLYDQSIEQIKNEFLNQGMELLAPDEFLTNDILKKSYYNTPLPNLEGKASIFDAAGNEAAVPDGFRLLPYPSISLSGNKFAKEKTNYLEAMNLDAYVIIVVQLSGSQGTISGVKSLIYYKNPGYPSALKQKEIDGKVIPYGSYGSPTIAGRGEVTLKLKKPINGIFLKKEEAYVNKKGKDDIRFVNEDMNPNISILIVEVVKRTVNNTVAQITKPVKKGKKKN